MAVERTSSKAKPDTTAPLPKSRSMRQWLVLGSKHTEQTPVRDYNTIRVLDKQTVARQSQCQLRYCTSTVETVRSTVGPIGSVKRYASLTQLAGFGHDTNRDKQYKLQQG